MFGHQHRTGNFAGGEYVKRSVAADIALPEP